MERSSIYFNMTELRKNYVTDETTGDTLEIDSLGHAGVVNHAHSEGGHILFKKTFSASEDVILIDLSDTTNYPHDNTVWLHTSNMTLDIQGDATADYVVTIGFLASVDGTDGDFHEIFEIDGSKKAGSSHTLQISQAPEAPKLKAGSFVGPMSENDTAFQTDVNLASTLDPATADTPSGSGDMVMRVLRTAGTFSVNLMIGYHSHS